MLPLRPYALLLITIIVAFSVYFPGLQGGFLFDDYPNLSAIGDLGGVTNWETFRAFVFSGWSGPTGRPIALASFLLDDNTWPSYAPWFKLTNLFIHLLCGLLLCWATLLLVRNFKTVTEQQAQWIAVLTCALWLLHPYMVSTTLYVVQRMAQLATLFSLAGITLYLYGRLQLVIKPVRGYVLMTLAIGLFTVLATYSKENGALLPLLILVIEFCLPKDQNKPIWQWRALCLWLPSLAIALLMARYINFSENPWPTRNFNQVERLFTETRIVCEYLLHLYVPRIEGNGLYQDGYVISKGLLTPISTLISLLTLLTLFISAFLVRNKAPIISLAILFFFAAHLMESTVIGLELYFEHRNYLAALFLLLPIAYYSVILYKSYKTIPLIVGAILLLLSSMTYLRASLWGDNNKLELYWTQAATESPRAINSMATFYINHYQYDEALQYLEQQSDRLPHSSLLTARLLLLKVHTQTATEQDFLIAAEKLKYQQFDAQTVKGVRTLVETIAEGSNTDYVHYAFTLLDTMLESPIYNQFPLFKRLTPYLKAKLFVYLNEEEMAFQQYSQAMRLYNKTDSALAMVAEVATAGYLERALQLLQQAEEVLLNQPDKKLKRSRQSYEQDITYLYKVLNNSIQIKEQSNEN